MKRRKIYYVPGLISILGLPVLLLFMGPREPERQVVLKLNLPTDAPDSGYIIRFSRASVLKTLKGKKIITVDLDDLPSKTDPDYTVYWQSGFILREMVRLHCMHDTSEVLDVHFGEQSDYAQFVWAIDNVSIYCVHRYVLLDDNLYIFSNPPPVRDTVPDLYFGSDDILQVYSHLPPGPGQWELFCRWADITWQETIYVLHFSYPLAIGFLTLIVLPGIRGTVRLVRRKHIQKSPLRGAGL